jgi:beta-glucosidase
MVKKISKVWTKASFSGKETLRETTHRQLAREIAGESIVLLKNNDILPISPCKIALFGAGAATTIKGGTGSGEVNSRATVTIWEGLQNAGFTVLTENWLKGYVELLKREKAAFYVAFNKRAQKALFGGDDFRINIMSESFHYPAGERIAKTEIQESVADTCVYVITRQAGECSDRKFDNYEYTLEPAEIENIKICALHYRKTILAINIGGSIDLSPLDGVNGVDAIVYFGQQGMEGGNAFADVLTGKTPPSGCLTNTWAMRYDDLPYAQEYSYLKGNIDKEYYKEGIFVGYRYFDSFDMAPRYPFGFGLTYSDFSCVCTGVRLEKSRVFVTASIKNAGSKHSGKKVVQLYLSCPSSEISREYQSLASFTKTKLLAPGEGQEVTLTLDLKSFAAYDESTSSYMLEAGDYLLRLGFSSRETSPCAVIKLGNTVLTEKCKRICPLKDSLSELKPSGKPETVFLNDIPVLSLSAGDIDIISHNYNQSDKTISPKVAKWMKTLSTSDKIKLLLGSGMQASGYFTVPGCSAVTTSDFTKFGIANIALADGPAGLRVQTRSVITKSGAVKAIDPMMEFLQYMSPMLKKFMFGAEKQGELIYQYTTAFPVGTALAQTWNENLANAFGDAVGVEMEEYGVTFWLAPGMNIQRNPLGGRNYEYYSEDPLLTGKMSAAVTRGVQSHDGCYVTAKHFAANNQEWRRNHSDSIVSERTLREIYLKGFEITVKEGGAKGLMTSYNHINGTYTANSYDLCTVVLRNEWGFEGVVMTDWFATGKGMADGALAVKAGNDMIMPGGKAYGKSVEKGLSSGVVALDDIDRSCARVLTAIANSNIQREFEERMRNEEVRIRETTGV